MENNTENLEIKVIAKLLGSRGGRKNVEKNGKEHMRRIVTERWERIKSSRGDKSVDKKQPLV